MGSDKRSDFTPSGLMPGAQVLRATFPGIRDCVRELIRVRMDTLALKFHETKDMAAHYEIYQLAGEHSKLKEPWVFKAKSKT